MKNFKFFLMFILFSSQIFSMKKSMQVSLNCQLIKAIEDKKLEQVKHFIESGASVNASNSMGETALMLGAEKLPESIEHLLKAGANVNEVDVSGATFLMAVSKCRPEIVKYVLDYCKKNNINIDLNVKDGWHGYNALMYASGSNQPKVVKHLIQFGADVNIKSNDGSTALMIAAASNSGEAVNYLALAKADLSEIKDKFPDQYKKALNIQNQVKALFNLLKNYKGNESCILNLINWFGKQNLLDLITDSNKNTPLHYSVLNGDKIASVIILGYCPELIGIKNKQGLNPVQLAVGFNRKSILKFFLNLSNFK